MTFARRLDRWVLATALLSTTMFLVASDSFALAIVAAGLIVLGHLSNARRSAERRPGSGAFVMLLNALTLGVLGYAVVRVSGDRELLVESVGQMLVWSLVIRVFDPRPGRRRGLLLLMSVFGALAAVLTSNALLVGLLLAVYAPVATWTIMLHQFAKGHEQAYERTGASGPRLAVPREGLRRLRAIALRLSPVALVVAAAVYLLMPRGVGADMLGEWDTNASGATTGFTDRVMLQRSGQLSSSDETVMDVVVTDSRGVNVGAPDRPLLLRGAVLDRYDAEAHAWVRSDVRGRLQTRGSDLTPAVISRARSDTPLTTYRVTLRNKDTDYLFAPMRPVTAYMDRDTTLEIGVPDLVVRAERRDGRMTYSIDAAPEWAPNRDGDRPLPGIDAPRAVVDLAERVLADADLRRDPAAGLTDDDATIARTIESYLRRTGVYDTEMTVSPAGVDPIEHFLLERMSGHCEQFASGMAAMLRGVGVSARVVTGYRAHEFNDIAGHYTVRQRDAHAWVEVRTGEGVWQSFDPSPIAGGGLGLAARTGLLHRARQAYEAVEHLWVVYVVSFDEQMKRSLLERFGIDLREMAKDMRRGDARAWTPGALGARLLRAAGAGLIAFAAAAGLLYATVAAARLLGRRVRLPSVRIRWARRGRPRALIEMERRFARAMSALARCGLERPAASGAVAHASAVAAVDAPLGEAVRALASMHYAARFGGRAMNEVELARADALVREVEERSRAYAKRSRKGVARGG